MSEGTISFSPHHVEENKGGGNIGKIKGRTHHKRTETRII